MFRLVSRHGEFLPLEELNRLPPLPQDQTSARPCYLTATTAARSGFVLWLALTRSWRLVSTNSRHLPAKA